VLHTGVGPARTEQHNIAPASERRPDVQGMHLVATIIHEVVQKVSINTRLDQSSQIHQTGESFSEVSGNRMIIFNNLNSQTQVCVDIYSISEIK